MLYSSPPITYLTLFKFRQLVSSGFHLFSSYLAEKLAGNLAEKV